MSMDLKDEHQSSSQQSPKLLPRRKTSKSRSSRKSTKDDIKYQRFVRDLKRDIQFTMGQSRRENGFDPCNHQALSTDASIRLLRTTIKSRQSPTRSTSRQTDHTETADSDRSDPLSFLKYNETKRLAADVETILTGSAMKEFYSQFIRCSSNRSRKT